MTSPWNTNNSRFLHSSLVSLLCFIGESSAFHWEIISGSLVRKVWFRYERDTSLIFARSPTLDPVFQGNNSTLPCFVDAVDNIWLKDWIFLIKIICLIETLNFRSETKALKSVDWEVEMFHYQGKKCVNREISLPQNPFHIRNIFRIYLKSLLMARHTCCKTSFHLTI